MEPIKIMLKKGDSMMSAFANTAKKVDLLNEIVNRGIVMAKAKKIDNLVDAMAISEKVLDKVSLYTCRYKVEGDDDNVIYTITFGYSFPKDQYGSYIINFQFISSACAWADEMDEMAHEEAQNPNGNCPFTSCFEALIGMYVAKMICEALCIDDTIKPPTDRNDALKLAEEMMKELELVRKVFDKEPTADDAFDKEVRKVYEHFKDSYVKVEPCGCLCDQDDDEDDDGFDDPEYEMVSEDRKWVHLPIIEGVDYTVENDDKEIRIYVDMSNAADDAEIVVGFPDDMDVVEKEIWDNRTLYVISKEA